MLNVESATAEGGWLSHSAKFQSGDVQAHCCGAASTLCSYMHKASSSLTLKCPRTLFSHLTLWNKLLMDNGFSIKNDNQHHFYLTDSGIFFSRCNDGSIRCDDRMFVSLSLPYTQMGNFHHL